MTEIHHPMTPTKATGKFRSMSLQAFNEARQMLREMTGGPVGPAIIRVRYTDTAVEWYRRPRSKKKRIRKKWRQRDSNWRPIRGGYIVMGTLYIHPAFRKEIEAQIQTLPESPAGWDLHELEVSHPSPRLG